MRGQAPLTGVWDLFHLSFFFLGGGTNCCPFFVHSSLHPRSPKLYTLDNYSVPISGKGLHEILQVTPKKNREKRKENKVSPELCPSYHWGGGGGGGEGGRVHIGPPSQTPLPPFWTSPSLYE